ncbi:hypothetical protein [Klenkia taihuensis]|uniref:Uncharacterized protein n=1 Tax=Klenkia taihuensis TaxID=1225127 RepID=A0A1I1QNZ3_9ACTN|nr:hypothetical protein [Klenkia taihuensis]GHE07636.1 hypothetical protein GCM10011381_04890 [Klenkia taihuensis]SFD23745.1 hypothetical protein SAMN05661030_2881 [Klenkia taihuensis]
MVDLDRVTEMVGLGDWSGVELPEGTHIEQIGPGRIHADFGDPDHVFLVTVQQVTRRQLVAEPRPVLTRADGVVVELRAVEVANHVTLTLSATGPAAAAGSARYRSDVDAWARRVRAALDAGRSADPERPPRHPADDVADLPVELTDDAGTTYAWVTGMAGHEDDPWRYVLHLRPTPPPEARALRIRVGDGDTVDLDLPPRDGC